MVQTLQLMKCNNMLVQKILHGTLIHLLLLGGEEYIQEVQNSLKKILGKNTVTYKEFQTILYEIEIILNNRP